MAYIVAYRQLGFNVDATMRDISKTPSTERRIRMTRSKVSENGTIVWGVFEKLIAGLLISFLGVTLGGFVTTAVLTVQLAGLKENHAKDVASLHAENAVTRSDMQLGDADRYTGTQAAADRASNAVERSAIRAKVEEHAKLLTQLQVAIARLEQMTANSDRDAELAKEQRQKLEQAIQELQQKNLIRDRLITSSFR